MIKWVSHQDKNITVSLDKAIMQGLSVDGGLFVPEKFPNISLDNLSEKIDFPQFAAHFLKPFFKGSSLEDNLLSLCQKSFNFPLPLIPLSDNLLVLELFHGPTLSFKDFGARFLAHATALLCQTKPRTIVVATSGDTGSAVASSFYQLANIKAAILFPKGRISQRQKQQICAFSDNILAIEVNGTFDDCQALVKKALSDECLQKDFPLSTANSINIARVLAQMCYFAYISFIYQKKQQQPLNIVIPSGNLGHATACFYAKKMGAPIAEITIATNANQAVAYYLKHKNYQAFATIKTLANAMDVGAPSNMMRLIDLWQKDEALLEMTKVYQVTDKAIKTTIKETYQHYQYVICPHTACGFFAAKNQLNQPTLVAATAHPAKFESIVEPIIAHSITPPIALADLLAKKMCYKAIENDYQALMECIKISNNRG